MERGVVKDALLIVLVAAFVSALLGIDCHHDDDEPNRPLTNSKCHITPPYPDWSCER